MLSHFLRFKRAFLRSAGTPFGSAGLCLLVACGVAWGIACSGGESGPTSSSATPDASVAEKPDAVGRWNVESVRLSVREPLILRWDSATGEVTEREILGKGPFKPVARESPPGASLASLEAGRYSVRVIPGRLGSALLRLDTKTGEVWLLHLNTRPRRWVSIPVRGSTAEAAKFAEKAIQAKKKEAGAPTPGAAENPTLEQLVELLEAKENPQDVRAGMPDLIVIHYPEAATQALLPSLQDDDPVVVVSVIDALPVAKDPSVAPALQPLLSHPDDRVAEAVRRKLGGAK